MHEMMKNTIARLAVQTVGACFGILGLMWVYLGCYFAFTGIRDSDLFQMLYMTPMFLLLGAIAVTVAWRSIRHFGPKSVQAVTGLLAFSVYTGLMALLRPFQEATWDLKMRLHHSATFLIPILLAYLLYRVLSRKLIQLTKTESIQQTPGGDSSTRADAGLGTPQE